MRLSFADGLFWTSVACCAFAQFFILRSVGGGRHVPEASAYLPRRRFGLERLWVILPAIGLGALLLFTWRTIRATTDDEPPIRVAEQQRGGSA